jgi:hypothetical protein
LERILVKGFLNGVHRGATPANIVSGFRATGVRPFNPIIPLTSQFAVDPHDLTLYQMRQTGTEVNEMVLTFPEGLKILCQHELGWEVQDAEYNVRYSRSCNRLRMNSISEELPISNPLSLVLRIDTNSIRQVNIQELDPSTKLSETGIVILKDCLITRLQFKSISLSDQSR